MKTDGDFEDREGHQAPFTLRENNGLNLRADLLRECVEIRPIAGLELGVKDFTVEADFKSARTGGNQFHGIDSRSFSNADRQTDGTRFVVSDRAIFDRDVCFHSYAPFERESKAAREAVKKRCGRLLLERDAFDV